MKKAIAVYGMGETKYYSNKLKAYNWVKFRVEDWEHKSYSKIIQDLKKDGYTKVGEYQIYEITIN